MLPPERIPDRSCHASSASRGVMSPLGACAVRRSPATEGERCRSLQGAAFLRSCLRSEFGKMTGKTTFCVPDRFAYSGRQERG